MIDPIKGPVIHRPHPYPCGVKCNIDKVIGENKIVACSSTDIIQLSNGKTIVVNTVLKQHKDGDKPKILDVEI